jgi:type 2A phosphatase activator TIP41
MAEAFSYNITTEVFEQSGWKFSFNKCIILKTSDMDALMEELKLQSIPEVIFGNNICKIENPTLNFCFSVSPKEALRLCLFEERKKRLLTEYNKTERLDLVNINPPEIQVKYSETWSNKKLDDLPDIKILDKISDCFYSTPYKGTISKIIVEKSASENNQNAENSSEEKLVEKELENLQINTKPTPPYLEKTEENIPLGNLKENNPIKWANVITLYEDELGDNGLAQVEFRFRVMGDCFFGLLRHYLRVDDVLIRIYDTRIYHDFKQNYILREFTAKEESYENIKKKGFVFTHQFNTEPAQSFQISEFLETKLVVKEKIILAE